MIYAGKKRPISEVDCTPDSQEDKKDPTLIKRVHISTNSVVAHPENSFEKQKLDYTTSLSNLEKREQTLLQKIVELECEITNCNKRNFHQQQQIEAQTERIHIMQTNFDDYFKINQQAEAEYKTQINQKLEEIKLINAAHETRIKELEETNKYQLEQKSANQEQAKEEINSLTIQIEKANSQNLNLIKDNEIMKSEKLCQVCFQNQKNAILLPCSHLLICDECALKIYKKRKQADKKCPFCRQCITSFMTCNLWIEK